MREIFRREIRREKVRQNGPFYTTPMATKLNRMVTYLDGLLPIK